MKQHAIPRITKYCIPGVSLIPREGHYQVRKIGLSAERVRDDPAFARTRKQAAQLSAALKIAHQLQAILAPLTGIKKMAPRLVGIVKKALAGHTIEEKEYIELNPEAQWKECVAYTPFCPYNHQKQHLSLHIPAHIPATALKTPPGVTHYRLIATTIRMDDLGHIISSVSLRSSAWPLKLIRIAPTMLKQAGQAIKGQQYWIFVYIQWYLSDGRPVALRKSEIQGPLILTEIIKY